MDTFEIISRLHEISVALLDKTHIIIIKQKKANATMFVFFRQAF